jgi:hypothetical protein
MATSTLVTDYLGYGTAASRPASPNLPTGAVGIYFATDTGAVSLWNGSASAWVTISSSQLNSMANLDILSNISGSAAVPTGNTLTAILDAVMGSTQGSILYRGASDWALLGPGTSGDVLTTQGAGANPGWAAGGGGGGSGDWQLISTVVASAASSVSWTGVTSSYAYKVIMDAITLNSPSGNAELQVGYGATPTYINSGYTGAYLEGTSSGIAEGSLPAATGFGLIATGSAGELKIFGCDAGSSEYVFDLHGTYGPGTNYLMATGKVANGGNQATAFQILPDGGTISGRFSLYSLDS